MKRLAWYSAIVLATLTLLLVFWEFRLAIGLFLISLVVASVLRPVVDSLSSHKVPRGLALTFTYMGVVIFLVALIFFMVGPLMIELQGLASDLPKTYQQVHSAWLNGSWLQRTIATNFPDFNKFLNSLPGGQLNIVLQSFMNITRTTLELGSDVIIVFALSIYWSADEEHFKRLWLSLLPSPVRIRSREVWQNLEKEVGAYLRSELIQSFLTLILLAIGYRVIGLRYPLLLAFFGALSWLIVWFGGLAAAILAFAAGLSISLGMALLTLLFTIGVFLFLELVIQPRLLQHVWISSLLMIIMVVFMVSEFGIIGFIFAPPFAAMVQILGRQIIYPPSISTVPIEAPPVIQIDALKDRLNTIQLSLPQSPD